jgi:CelD/BcsL family acetyltransferase involved in cellulose biosynthesis
VCKAVAEWLVGANTKGVPNLPRKMVWDALELIGVDMMDEPINCLAQAMRDLGLTVQQSAGIGCYVIDVPATWDDYVKMRSKSGRREIRQSLKSIDNGAITVRHIRTEQELDEVWDQFVALHQRRRHASGTTGCFDDPSFERFLRRAASRLLDVGLLKFVIASTNDTPVAAQFAVADEENWYFYQSGMEPDASHIRPGLSVFCHAIRETIESGRKRFDMMRDDEPYKLRWRAELQPAQEIRVCSPNMTSQMRNQVYNAGVTFKNLVKSSFGLGQPQS